MSSEFGDEQIALKMAGNLTLNWHEHNNSLVSVLQTLLDDNSLVDCTLAAGGKYLKAHKVVLSASSPYFQLLFSQENDKNPIVILKDVQYECLKWIIDFVYRGEVQVHETHLKSFLEVAQSLQIKGLDSRLKEQATESPHLASRNVPEQYGASDQTMDDDDDDDYDAREVVQVVDGTNKTIMPEQSLELSLSQAQGAETIKIESAFSISTSVTASQSENDLENTEALECSRSSLSSVASSASNFSQETQETNHLKRNPFVRINRLIESDIQKTGTHCGKSDRRNGIFQPAHGRSLQWRLSRCQKPEREELSLPSREITRQRTQEMTQAPLTDTTNVPMESPEAVKRSVTRTEPHDGELDANTGPVSVASTPKNRVSRTKSVSINALSRERPSGVPDSKNWQTGGMPPFRYSCPYCPKLFRRTNDLNVHRRRHTGERPFQCTVCLQAFVQASGLSRHRRVHTGERAFKCGVCQKAFAREEALKNHTRLHTGERPYACACGKAFPSQSRLISHRKVHTDGQYKCDECGAAFRSKPAVAQHWASAHASKRRAQHKATRGS